MIRIKDDCIELSLGGRVATLASGGTPGERLVEAALQLEDIVGAASELADEAYDGEMPTGDASPLRIVRQDGRGSVSRGQLSVTVTYRGLVLGRATGDRVGVRSVMAQALEQTDLGRQLFPDSARPGNIISQYARGTRGGMSDNLERILAALGAKKITIEWEDPT